MDTIHYYGLTAQKHQKREIEMLGSDISENKAQAHHYL
jgi:hypothetical protein